MNTTPAEKEAIVYLTLREILENIPVVGGLLNNVFFEFRAKVKQDRVNRLVEALARDLSQMNIDPQQFCTEENVDLIDTIFTKAAATRSDKKREGLKNILLHGLTCPGEIEYCEIFAEHILSIHPKELEILAAHPFYLIDGRGLIPRINELKTQLDYFTRRKIATANPHSLMLQALKSEYHKMGIQIPKDSTGPDLKLEKIAVEKMLEEYRVQCGAERFGISKEELKFFLQNLLSKGLLRDDGAATHGTGATEVMSITQLGLKFLDFIKL